MGIPVGPRGADLVVRSLSREGTKHVFSLSGNQIMPIYDALVDVDVNLYHVRHEAAAVHMADAWGRLTGRPGVALVTAGPGFANTLSALYVARMAESPLVLISGSSSDAETGQGAFQEMPQAHMAEPVTKASWTASDPSDIGAEIERAFNVSASGRPGPVHVAIPVDTLEAHVAAGSRRPPEETRHEPGASADDATAARFLDLLRDARRPLLIAGPAASRGDSRRAIDELGDAAGIPAAYMESPRGVADPSLGAFAEVLAEADLVVLMGKKLDFMLKFGGEPTFSADCRFIQIDAEESTVAQTGAVLGDAGRRLALRIVADPATATRGLLAHVGVTESRDNGWASEVRDAIAFRPRSWQDLGPNLSGAMHPVQVCREIQKLLGDSGVFVSDGGEFGQWAQACITAPERLINGPSGAIGSAIPFALAARLARPEAAPVVATLGDGTFGFHAMELDTAVRYGIPFGPGRGQRRRVERRVPDTATRLRAGPAVRVRAAAVAVRPSGRSVRRPRVARCVGCGARPSAQGGPGQRAAGVRERAYLPASGAGGQAGMNMDGEEGRTLAGGRSP